jgi:hypothetical protein
MVRWRRRECGAAQLQPGVDGGDAAAQTVLSRRVCVRRGEAVSAARSGGGRLSGWTHVARGKSTSVAWPGGGRLSGRTRAVLTAPLRRGVARCMAATRRRCTDRQARCRERETNRWVPRVSDFRIKIYSRTKIAQNKYLEIDKNSQKNRGGRKSNLEHFS